MISATELRIGNWVIPVLELQGEDTDFEYLPPCQVSEIPIIEAHKTYNPISLTPEVLIACGFEDLNTEYCDSFRLEPFCIEFLPDTDIMIRMELGIESYAFTLIRTRRYALHEFQNLFYSITNTELKYKP